METRKRHIHLFNRREVFTTFSPEAKELFQDRLEECGIDYRISTSNLDTPPGAKGEGVGLGTQYTFYVHRDDYDSAESLR